MQRSTLFNRGWVYRPSFTDAYIHSTNHTNEGFESIVIPHTNLELPYNYFDEKSYQFISTYAKTFDFDPAWSGKNVYLDFGAVMLYAEVYLNGTFITSHKGGYTPFSADLTAALVAGTNTVVVKVDSTERDDIPPFGFMVDYLTYGGVYRDINLRVVDPIHISNIKVEASDVLDPSVRKLTVGVFLANTAASTAPLNLRLTLYDGETKLASVDDSITLSGQAEELTHLSIADLKDIELWSVDSPKLYQVHVSLNSDNAADQYSTRFGFRDAVFTTEGFFLNGEPLYIMGLNRHQSYPYVGYAMPDRAQMEDADLLKYELGLNLVRTSHYPQSVAFLDRCDEIGLMVFTELPGWQHIGDEGWQNAAIQSLEEMIKRDWNHPSVILWGVRINESSAHHDLYTKTNAIARTLDPTRQTGGVRDWITSELLEDVYTMNDFHLGSEGSTSALREPREVTGLDYDVPYMVTEYNGHMYSTKRQDGEDRQREHTLRHAKVIDEGRAHKNISGTIGWCAFDYNTHQDFGSGDKVCYHGVMDMFRQAKFAAYAYRSQIDPSVQVVLEPITVFGRGDKSGGYSIPFLLMTNCDYVMFEINGQASGPYYPDCENFKGLAHPPVFVEDTLDEWGSAWLDATFVGYIDGKIAVKRPYLASPVPARLHVQAQSDSLDASLFDATRVDISLLDAVGNRIVYMNQNAHLTIEGAAAIIGPHEAPLTGGTTAVWVKSLANDEQGTARLTVKIAGFTTVIEIEIQ